MLHEFITANREEIIRRCRVNPPFLDQLVEALRSGGASTLEVHTSAGERGQELLLQGFTVSEVVHHYADVRQIVTELAAERHAPISADDSHMFNRYLDDAIASALTAYTRDSEQSRVDHAAERGNEQIGFLVHELRNLVNTAMIAFEVLKTGNVGPAGSTGAVLNRSLTGLRDLIARSLDEVRLTHGVTDRKQILVSPFIEEVGTTATLAANARGVKLIVAPVQSKLAVNANQQILAAVVGNLLQNAFKFTKPHSTVSLRVRASADRVLIEVQDECGGLPGGDVDEMFRPFEQRGADRTGLGIGLAFSRWGVEANGGRLYARNLPEKGCVFTVDLPRSPGPGVVLV